MEKCVEYLELISAYADGELTETEKRRVETHLEACENCSAILELYREISVAAVEASVPAPDALRNGVMGQILGIGTISIDDYAKRRKTLRIVLSRVVPVAACLALMLLTLPRLFNINRAADQSTGAGTMSMMEMAMDASVAVGGSGEGGSDSNAQIAPSSGEAELDMGPGAVQRADAVLSPEAAPDLTVEPDSQPEPLILIDTDTDDMSYPGGEDPQDSILGDDSVSRTGVAEPTGDSLLVVPYYSIIEITGDLPEQLSAYVSIQVDDVVAHYIIPRDSAKELIEELSGLAEATVLSVNEEGEYALVIYIRGD